MLTDRDKQALGVFEKKIIRELIDPVTVLDEYRIRNDTEMYELYADIDIIQRINVQRLRCLGHVVRMDDRATAKDVFNWDVIVCCGVRFIIHEKHSYLESTLISRSFSLCSDLHVPQVRKTIARPNSICGCRAKYVCNMSRIIEEEGDQSTGGKTKWRRNLSTLVLLIGEDAQKTA